MPVMLDNLKWFDVFEVELDKGATLETVFIGDIVTF